MKIYAKPIEMISLFNESGGIRPIRFRLKTEDENELVVPVNTIMTQGQEIIDKRVFRVFTCLVILNEIQRICEIRYDLSTMKWTLHRI